MIGGSNAVNKGKLGRMTLLPLIHGCVQTSLRIKKILGEGVKKTKDSLTYGICDFYVEHDMEI